MRIGSVNPDDLLIQVHRFVVTQPVADHILLVQRDQGSGGQPGLHRRRIADCGDRVGGTVGASVEQQGVADAAGRRGGDQPLVLHLDRFSAGAPHRVEDGLDVLLVHDQVVGGGVAREAPIGVALRVGQRHRQARPVHRDGAGVFAELSRPFEHRCQRTTDRTPVGVVDTGGQRVSLRAETLD